MLLLLVSVVMLNELVFCLNDDCLIFVAADDDDDEYDETLFELGRSILVRFHLKLSLFSFLLYLYLTKK